MIYQRRYVELCEIGKFIWTSIPILYSKEMIADKLIDGVTVLANRVGLYSDNNPRSG